MDTIFITKHINFIKINTGPAVEPKCFLVGNMSVNRIMLPTKQVLQPLKNLF